MRSSSADAELRHIRTQAEGRHEVVQRGDLEPVHRELHVAQLLGGVGLLGQAGLEGEDALGRLFRMLFGVSEVAELPGDVGDVLRAQRDRLLVVARVVVALWESQPALADVDEIDVRVFEVGRDAQGVERTRPAALQIAHDGSDVGGGRGPRDTRQIRFERLHPGGGDRRLIHRGGEVVAHHLAGRSARLRLGRCILEQLVQHVLVARMDHLRRTPGAVLGGDGVGVKPAAVHVSVEVVGHGYVRIEERRVDRALRVAHEALLECVVNESQSARYPFAAGEPPRAVPGTRHGRRRRALGARHVHTHPGAARLRSARPGRGCAGRGALPALRSRFSPGPLEALS
jgi:hypothetical protein